MSLKSKLRLSAMYCFLVAAPAFASDNSLYAEAAPEDASFVRFVGFNNAQEASFAGKTFKLKADETNAYIPVSSSLLEGIAKGTFVTVLRDGDGQIEEIMEGERNNRSKVVLFLVNGSEQTIDLRLADNSATVIPAVDADTAAQQEVNPVAVTFGVFTEGSTDPLATFDVSLQRGQNVSFVVDDTNVRLIEHHFGTVAK